jgi:hypothetical protein
MLLKTSPSLTTPPAGSSLPAPTPWPGANARLLGLGAGLPVHPLDRLASFGDEEFERFVFEWAHGFLTKQLPEGSEIQWRGGAGDKGRDIIALIGPPRPAGRPWKLFQCKHYAQRLGPADAVTEIGKILYYTWIGEYSAPDEMWFATHRGVTNTLQDLVDAPEELRAHILKRWDKDCKNKITSKRAIELTPDLKAHIEAFDFSIFRVKQPMDIVEEHRQTEYHLVVFGVPLVERPPPPKPPSQVAPEEAGYVKQLFKVIAEHLGAPVSTCSDFGHLAPMKGLFERSRLTFYCAEGLKELARDQMADEAYFHTLQQEFADGLYYTYIATHPSGLEKLRCTIESAVGLQLSDHPLKPLVTPNDRAGICHHIANDGHFHWCGT